jgi:hypothetical protein
MSHSIGKVTDGNQVLETRNIELLAEKAIVGSELNVRALAADKLGLVKISKGQVGLYNRQHHNFVYR